MVTDASVAPGLRRRIAVTTPWRTRITRAQRL
jgi:hypothetical protein